MQVVISYYKGLPTNKKNLISCAWITIHYAIAVQCTVWRNIYTTPGSPFFEISFSLQKQENFQNISGNSSKEHLVSIRLSYF